MSFSSLSILTAWLLGLVVFILSFKEKNSLHKSSLRQWAAAFLLFSLYRIPAALFNLGIALKFVSLTAIYAITLPLAVIAYILFYRGVAILITKEKFWINKLPVIVFAIFTSLIFTLHFLFETPAVTLMGITRLFNYFIILLIIAASIKALRVQDDHLISPRVARIGTMLIILGWMVYMISDIYIWQTAKMFPMYFLALVNVPYAYLGFIVAQFLMLIGIVLASYHSETPPGRYKKYALAFGLSALVFAAVIGLVSQPESLKADISLLSEEGKSVLIGQNFETTVNINAQSPINAAEATISYPIDMLEVASISKDDSIFNFWIEEPSFDNASGTIRFAGVLHDGQDGFYGNGRILTIVFKSKKTGEAKIDFAEAMVLAADSQGTDITGEKKGMTYSVTETPRQPSYDLNGDNKINVVDVSILIYHWGNTDNPQYDINNDGKVNLTDLSILISRMGK